jgi:pyridoxamine 5'-phosphate oxidase
MDSESEIPQTCPFELFDIWLKDAEASEPNDPNAMALATASEAAAPSVRMVLLKGHGPDGFVFYTNAESRKGEEIRANMQAALLFHWKSLRRQIRIEGPLEEVSGAEADAYFHSRSFLSQTGSAASDQSRPLAERSLYTERVAKLTAQYESAGKVPRPPHWTGFRMAPTAIEFWRDRPGRLHDRRRFTRPNTRPNTRPDTRPNTSAQWSNTLLYP